MKKCTKCGGEKPLDKFVKDSRISSGVRTYCKMCANGLATENRKLRQKKLGRGQIESKKCSTCKIVKPASEFNHKPGTKDGLQPICKPCKKIWNHNQRKKKLAENVDYEVERHLQKAFGMSLKEYLEIERNQGHKCALCSTNDPGTRKRNGANKSRFCVDHDHETGEIRGLLCTNCNRGLGLLGDTLERLEAAAAYLRKHKHGH
ncbi:MAG: hypothetical protein E3J82_02525 [Candidatus Thorarchaeota archaeon]|nr:MAG: hypothetical protein E3J82_02525 [Candidatus Thorarchaeota archaeon]